MLNKLQPSKRALWGYLLPSFIIFLGVMIIPLIMSGVLSFFKFTSIKNFTFVGLDHYRQMLQDKNVLVSLKNNLTLIVVCLVGQVGIAFLLACWLNMKGIVCRRFHQTVVYFPVTLSAVVVGYVWSMVFDFNYGLLAKLMRDLGYGASVRPWLGQANSVMLCVCIPMVWQYIGFHLVIILSAMTSIDPAVLEMAEIDGASEWQRAFKITLPLIRDTLIVCVSLCISAQMRAFDHIVAMSNGGPGYSSSVMALYAYKQSFSNLNMGYGSALSVLIFAITAIFFLLSNGIGSRRKDELR